VTLARRSARPTDAAGILIGRTFKIGEAARLCAVKPYVLRYGRREFRSIRPQKTRSQQRFTAKDLELLLKIRHLLYHERFTIEGGARAPARAR